MSIRNVPVVRSLDGGTDFGKESQKIGLPSRARNSRNALVFIGLDAIQWEMIPFLQSGNYSEYSVLGLHVITPVLCHSNLHSVVNNFACPGHAKANESQNKELSPYSFCPWWGLEIRKAGPSPHWPLRHERVCIAPK